MFDSFYNKISEVIDTHTPIKQLSSQGLKSRSKPSITSGIRISIRIKIGLFKKFLKTKSTYYHAKFKFYRNKLNHLINPFAPEPPVTARADPGPFYPL